MSSGVSKVEVLCPNGHRVIVNVTQSTKLLQVIEECCLKKNLGSSDGFLLKHNRRQLDLALPVRQAGLTNMAKLELVKAEAQREDAKVRIGLEVENERCRLQREFDPKTSLWDVVKSFEQDNGSGGQLELSSYRTENRLPVIVYVKEEVLGDYALQSTTLKMLGILKGAHLLKLSFKVISEEKLNEVREKIDKERDRLSRLAARAAAACASESSYISSDYSSSGKASFSGQPSAASVEPLEEAMDASDAATPAGECSGVMERATWGLAGNDFANAMTQNITPDRISPTVSQNDSRNNSFSAFFTRQDDSWLSPDSLRYLQPQSSPFAEFKFPEETKGKDVYRNEFSEVNRDDFLPCDREICLFSLNEAETEAVYVDDVGDDFFEHTVADIKVLQASLSREVLSLDDQPLMTQAMRNAQRGAKMSCYQRFIIRFQFPDRLVLQAVFRPAETVSGLYKFVKENLAEKNLSFELYTAPPRIVLEDRAQTLIEAGLGPLSLIYCKARNETDERNQTGFLAAEVLNNISSRAKAKTILDNHFPARNASVAQGGQGRLGDSSPGCSMQTTSSAQGQSRSTSAATRSSDKVPKWFNPAKK